MAYEKQIEDFAESKATWISSNDIPLVNTKQLVRGWKSVTDTEKSTNEAYLNAYVSPKNAAPSSTIVDPQADGSGTLTGGVLKNVFPGLWRHVSTAWDRANQVYVQTLRLGWASTVLTGSGPNDECMIRAGSDTRADARTYDFYWRNIAATSVDACVQALRALGSFANPQVQGEQKTGTFAFAAVTPQQSDDGSYTISVTAAKVVTITAIGDFADLSPLRRDIHDVENPFGLEGGYTGHVGRRPTDGIALTYRALTMASRAVIMALTDAELQGLLSETEQLKYEFVKRDLQEAEGGTLTLALVYQYVPLATTITAETARYVGIERKNQSNKIIIEISWPRIDPTAIGTISDTTLFKRDTVTDPVVEGITYSGEYFVNTTTAPMTDNDGIRIVQRMTKAGDQKLDLIIGKDPDHKIYEFWRWDISALDIGEFMTETGGEAHGGDQYNWGTPEIGKLKNVDTQKQADESFILHAIYSDTDDLTKVQLCPSIVGQAALSGVPLVVQDDYQKSTQKAYGWNIPVANLKTYSDYYAPTEKVVNQRNQFTISRQTEHVFDFQGLRETFVPVIAEWHTFSEDEFKKVEIREGAFVTADLLASGETLGSPSSVPVNNKYEQEFKENELGSFDGRLVHTEYYEYDTDEVLTEDSKARQLYRREGKYITSANIALNFARPAYAQGTLVELDVKPNEVGSFDAVKVTSIAVSQTNVAYEVDYSKVLARTETTAATAALTQPDPAAGFVKTVVNEERPDGKIKTVATSEEEQDQESGGAVVTMLEEVSVVAHTSDVSPTVPATAVQNQRVEIDEAPTRGGRVKSRVVTTEAQPWDSGATPIVVANDGLFETKLELFKNQTSPIAADSAGDRVDLQDNGLGGWNARKTSQALVASNETYHKIDCSSTLDWDPRTHNIKTPTWVASTDSGVLTRITGWNFFQKTLTRWRIKTITRETTHHLIRPDAALLSPSEIATIATGVDEAGDGAGTSFRKTITQVDGGWVKVLETANTTKWSDWILDEIIFVEWVPTAEGSAGA